MLIYWLKIISVVLFIMDGAIMNIIALLIFYISERYKHIYQQFSFWPRICLSRKKLEPTGTRLQGFRGDLLVNFLNNLYGIFKMRIAAYLLKLKPKILHLFCFCRRAISSGEKVSTRFSDKSSWPKSVSQFNHLTWILLRDWFSATISQILPSKAVIWHSLFNVVINYLILLSLHQLFCLYRNPVWLLLATAWRSHNYSWRQGTLNRELLTGNS